MIAAASPMPCSTHPIAAQRGSAGSPESICRHARCVHPWVPCKGWMVPDCALGHLPRHREPGRVPRFSAFSELLEAPAGPSRAPSPLHHRICGCRLTRHWPDTECRGRSESLSSVVSKSSIQSIKLITRRANSWSIAWTALRQYSARFGMPHA